METKALTSVITPVYDGDNPQYLKEAIESILSQTYNEIEFVIVMDGVKREHLRKIIYDYKKNHSNIVIGELPENRGIVHALNKAIELAKGKYLVRMDADDISHPRRIEKLVQYLEHHPEISFLGSYEYIIDNNGITVGDYKVPSSWDAMLRLMIWKVPVAHATVAFRSSFFAKVGPYRPIYHDEDTDLWFRAAISGIKGANIPEFLYSTRRCGEWVSRKGGLKNALANFEVRKYYLSNQLFPFYARFTPYLIFLMKISPRWLFKMFYKYLLLISYFKIDKKDKISNMEKK